MKKYYSNEHGVLYQGDCLEVLGNLDIDVDIDMVLADPPYGTTLCKWDKIIPFEEMWTRIWRITKENAAIVMTSQTPFDKMLGASCLRYLRYEWIWEKNIATGHLNAKRMPMKAHENVLVFYKKLPLYDPQKTRGHKPYVSYKKRNPDSFYGKQNGNVVSRSNGERYPRSVQKFSSDSKRYLFHPTQKPVSLFSYLIKTYTKKGDIVLDFCAGSGTTAIAAENTGRKWVCIEREEKYCKIIAKRLEQRNNCILNN